MSEQHPEDLPWNDAAADSDDLGADPEPDPAEVDGDEGDEIDLAAHRVPDPYEKYHAESLDQRLAEEEPEAGFRTTDEAGEAGDLVTAAEPDEDVDLGEPDQVEPSARDDAPAEEAAIHLTDRP